MAQWEIIFKITYKMKFFIKSTWWFNLNEFINMTHHITQVMNFFMYLSFWRETHPRNRFYLSKFSLETAICLHATLLFAIELHRKLQLKTLINHGAISDRKFRFRFIFISWNKIKCPRENQSKGKEQVKDLVKINL